MITITVYFHGPMTDWSRSVAHAEIVDCREFRFDWLARLHARRVIQSLNAGRCGYTLSRDGQVIEHVEATNKALQ